MSSKKILPKTKQMCTGCYNNDYNYGLGSAKECWSFESAEIIARLAIDVNRSPPYDWDNAEDRLSCYNKKGMVYIKKEALDYQGCWKK